MRNTYAFDSFQEQQKKEEMKRLTNNVNSHSKVICEYFFEHGLLESKKVLDVGCGTGAMLNMFAELLPDTQFYGVDNSMDILSAAEANNTSNVQLYNGNAAQLPFEDNSFDFVYTRLVLMHNQQPERIVAEMQRVCKPGGVLISVEIDDETMVFHPYDEEFSQLIRANIQYAKTQGTDRTMGRKLFTIYKNLGIENVKVITQTSDYEGAFEEIPFPLRIAIGTDEGQHLVTAGLITEEQRADYLSKTHLFSQQPHRFYSGSFMYCIGNKTNTHI